jgi:hypothetical protein
MELIPEKNLNFSQNTAFLDNFIEFSALSDYFFPINQNGQAAYAAPQAPHKPLVCLRAPSCLFVSSPFMCLNGSMAFWTGSKTH